MRIGVLGGGQLGRMLALAGYPLGHEFTFLDPTAEAIGGLGAVIRAPLHEATALDALAATSDVVTYEFENVPVDSVRRVAARVPVWPPPEALAVAQDRLVEKRFFEHCGIPTVRYEALDGPESLVPALQRLGYPAIVKTRRHGYDGKGQVNLGSPADLPAAYAVAEAAPAIVEQRVAFVRELSILAVRGADGASAAWPLVENRHEGGILRESLAPAPDVAAALQAVAERYARRVLERLGYVGVLAIELFEVEGGLIANEMAPRVHNSGHWTIEGAETSQFENHLRAVTRMPLGATNAIGASSMINLIGALPPDAAVLAVPGAHLHRYGKAVRPHRKVGHITVRAADRRQLTERLAVLRRALGTA